MLRLFDARNPKSLSRAPSSPLSPKSQKSSIRMFLSSGMYISCFFFPLLLTADENFRTIAGRLASCGLLPHLLVWLGLRMQVSVSLSLICTNNKPRLLVSTDGRRVVFLYSIPCLALGSFGVSISRSIPELLCWRVLQAVGSSAGMATGVAIIGDIYKLEERGTAVGITFGVGL